LRLLEAAGDWWFMTRFKRIILRHREILSAVNVLPVDVQVQAEENCIIVEAVVLVARRWTADAGSWPRRRAEIMHVRTTKATAFHWNHGLVGKPPRFYAVSIFGLPFPTARYCGAAI
jgi:hypothetical protein